jgi:hypothetical protein
MTATTSSRYFWRFILAGIVLMGFYRTECRAGGYNVYDTVMPTKAVVRASLRTVAGEHPEPILTPKKILALYEAEKVIGKYIQEISPAISDSALSQFLSGYKPIKDSSLAFQCVVYVRSHQSRFREVSDGWKGEENFWEPNDYWLTRITELFLSATERNIIAFDLDVKVFIRQFDVDVEAAGKSCEAYISGLLLEGRDGYKDVYSDDEINGWIPECIKNRETFEAGRTRLLEKYGRAPFTKRLKDIDVTTVVVYHSVC